MPETAFTPAELAACAEREAAFRRSCYPKWAKVATVAELPAAKQREIRMMEQIADDYRDSAAFRAYLSDEPLPVPDFGRPSLAVFLPACGNCGQRRDRCLCDVPGILPKRPTAPGQEEPPF